MMGVDSMYVLLYVFPVGHRDSENVLSGRT